MRMTHIHGEDEYNALPIERRMIVDAAILQSATDGSVVSFDFPRFNIYAYPHAFGTSWGVNAGMHGQNSARGLVSVDLVPIELG